MGDEKHQQELNAIHNQFSFPKNEEEAVAKWGKKPSPKHDFNMYGWYDPAEGVPRCYNGLRIKNRFNVFYTLLYLGFLCKYK